MELIWDDRGVNSVLNVFVFALVFVFVFVCILRKATGDGAAVR